MYVDSVTRRFAPWFKQTVVNGKYRGKNISVTSNYINDQLSFKSITVIEEGKFRECRKLPILGKLKTISDWIVQRKK